MSESDEEREGESTDFSIGLSAFEAFGSARGEGGEDGFAELNYVSDYDEGLEKGKMNQLSGSERKGELDEFAPPTDPC